MKTKPVKGKLYLVEFMDHLTGGDHSCPVQICGWYIGSNKDDYIFSTWYDVEDRKASKDTNDWICVIKKTVIKLKKLQR